MGADGCAVAGWQVGPVTSSVLNTLKRVIIIVVTSVVLGEVGDPPFAQCRSPTPRRCRSRSRMGRSLRDTMRDRICRGNRSGVTCRHLIAPNHPARVGSS